MPLPTPSLLPLLAAAALLSTPSSSLRADYPIASHRYLADPCVLVHDGRVYFFCSNDDENVGASDYLMQSLVCISSDDLKNWTDHGIAFQVPQNASWANRSWAPATIERDGTFYLYFGNGGSGIGVATADSPTGPYNDPLGQLLITWSTPGASGENMWLFDPYAFIDDDGQAYLYFGGNGESNVRVIKLNEDMISLDGAASSITAPGFFEAAWMHKRGDTYYFSYSTNPSNGLRIDYMTSDNPVSGFEYTGIVAGQPPSNNNNNHAGEFEFAGNWYHVYHNRFVANEAGDPPGYLRNLGIEPLFYNPDGSIQQVTYTRDDLIQVKNLNPFQRTEGETFANQNGVETDSSEAGGMMLTSLESGDWIQVRGVDFSTGAGYFTASVASENTASIELRLDAADGPLIGTCAISPTGGPQTWTTVETPIDIETAHGIHDLFLVFTGDSENLLNLDFYQFHAPPPPPASLSASPVSNSQIHLAWSTTENATSYSILRSSSAEDPFTPIAQNLAETAFTDSDLTHGTTYFYTVTATGFAGTSYPSAQITASPQPNYDEWTATTFPEETSEANRLPNADPDADGQANFLEYFAGTNPLEPNPAPFWIESATPNTLTLAYIKANNIATTTLTVLTSPNLSTWTNAPTTTLSESSTETQTTIQLTTPNTHPQFLRLSLEP